MRSKGFTLLEILLVVAAIGILATIVIVAINPNLQLAQVRNTERRSNVNTLAKALDQYLIENGEYPSTVSTGYQEICATGGGSGCINLEGDLVPRYIASIPVDERALGDGSGYQVGINPNNNKIAIVSMFSEMDEEIVFNPIESNFLLDRYGGAQVAYSTRLLSESGNSERLMRIRRQSDAYSADFGVGSSGLHLDLDSVGRDATLGDGSTNYTLSSNEDTLDEFCDATICEVLIWYDQSGNDLHATHTGFWPKIHDGLMYEMNGNPSLYFDGNNGLNISLALDGEVSSFISFRSDLLSQMYGAPMLGNMGGSGSEQSFYQEVGRLSGVQSQIWGDSLILSGSQSFTTTNSYISTQIRSGNLGSWQFSMYLNSVLDGQTTTSVNPNGGSVTNLGYAFGVSTFQGYISEVILFTSDQSAARVGIESMMCNYVSCN